MTGGGALAGATAIVVEDSFILGMELEERLAAAGVVVRGAFADVASARRAVERDPPDLAVLDVHVRDGSTVALASELEARGIRCVFVTGYGDIPRLPPELGGVRRLTKPLVAGELERALEALLVARGAGG